MIDLILAANLTEDIGELEEEIDWLAYDLYGLTNEETAAVAADLFWDGTWIPAFAGMTAGV